MGYGYVHRTFTESKRHYIFHPTIAYHRWHRSFSFADLSEKVNIRKAVFTTISSKAELVRVVVSEYRQEARAGMQALSRQLNNPVAELQAYADYWAKCIQDGSAPFCICAMLAAELPTLPPEVALEVTGHFADLSGWLTELLQRGEKEKCFTVRSTHASEAGQLMATVHGAMLAARAFNDAKVFQQIVQPMIDNILVSD